MDNIEDKIIEGFQKLLDENIDDGIDYSCTKNSEECNDCYSYLHCHVCVDCKFFNIDDEEDCPFDDQNNNCVRDIMKRNG